MPEFAYLGPAAHYPESRDEHGRLIGGVNPGDVRSTDKPLDHHWYPLEDVRDHPLLRGRPSSPTGPRSRTTRDHPPVRGRREGRGEDAEAGDVTAASAGPAEGTVPQGPEQ